ncbi:multiubiquitin domain-containing protein [Cryobacterium sp. 10S3]|uniref:multiubiquitin domain-containing protein n=1 Tax=unclassified Cryobacterium TaxID=2649013 RepID=UPI002AC93F04|nr:MULTISPECIES: multiubiquitin domain-containing protein [unclassified Cryobacterium]MEB0001684.1 multiubiquitin domain-containing protein [Cryobacterium sp. RTC2.1]MEB0286716.1 multiubiquitin domain-containing protein [Cryobacterium sp. 10S3]WPX13163.1 multiubiquitin domain-containing protein [Cryobacterium sp. 10S3]
MPGPTTIIVNTRSHPVTEKKISFEQVIELAYPDQPATEADSFTVRYSRGHDGHGSGTLTAGQDVPVKKEMVFDVYRTTRS